MKKFLNENNQVLHTTGDLKSSLKNIDFEITTESLQSSYLPLCLRLSLDRETFTGDEIENNADSNNTNDLVISFKSLDAVEKHISGHASVPFPLPRSITIIREHEDYERQLSVLFEEEPECRIYHKFFVEEEGLQDNLLKLSNIESNGDSRSTPCDENNNEEKVFFLDDTGIFIEGNEENNQENSELNNSNILEYNDSTRTTDYKKAYSLLELAFADVTSVRQLILNEILESNIEIEKHGSSRWKGRAVGTRINMGGKDLTKSGDCIFLPSRKLHLFPYGGCSLNLGSRISHDPINESTIELFFQWGNGMCSTIPLYEVCAYFGRINDSDTFEGQSNISQQLSYEKLNKILIPDDINNLECLATRASTDDCTENSVFPTHEENDQNTLQNIEIQHHKESDSWSVGSDLDMSWCDFYDEMKQKENCTVDPVQHVEQEVEPENYQGLKFKTYGQSSTHEDQNAKSYNINSQVNIHYSEEKAETNLVLAQEDFSSLVERYNNVWVTKFGVIQDNKESKVIVPTSEPHNIARRLRQCLDLTEKVLREMWYLNNMVENFLKKKKKKFKTNCAQF